MILTRKQQIQCLFPAGYENFPFVIYQQKAANVWISFCIAYFVTIFTGSELVEAFQTRVLSRTALIILSGDSQQTGLQVTLAFGGMRSTVVAGKHVLCLQLFVQFITSAVCIFTRAQLLKAVSGLRDKHLLQLV